MDKLLDDRIESLLENSRLKELICADDVTFARLLEIMHRKRRGIVYVPDDDIAGMDTPEG